MPQKPQPFNRIIHLRAWCRTSCQAPVIVIGDMLLLCACDGVMVLQKGYCQLERACAQGLATDTARTRVYSSISACRTPSIRMSQSTNCPAGSLHNVLQYHLLCHAGSRSTAPVPLHSSKMIQG